jgi:hypothetical protein
MNAGIESSPRAARSGRVLRRRTVNFLANPLFGHPTE